MANKIQVRRGALIDIPVLDVGEPGFTTDTEDLYIGGASGNVLVGSSFGSEFEIEASASVSSTTVTPPSWVEKLRLSKTLAGGDYNLLVSYTWNHSNLTTSFEAQIEQNDTTRLFHHYAEPADASGVFGATGSGQKYAMTKTIPLTLVPGAYTFDLDWRSAAIPGPPFRTSSIWEAVLMLWRIV